MAKRDADPLSFSRRRLLASAVTGAGALILPAPKTTQAQGARTPAGSPSGAPLAPAAPLPRKRRAAGVPPSPLAKGDAPALRARVRRLSPSEPVRIAWRMGGEGLGGTFRTGSFPAISEPSDAPLPVDGWSAWMDGSPFVPDDGERRFVTITAGRPGRPVEGEPKLRTGASSAVTFEIELRHRGRTSRIEDVGPRGGTVTLVLDAAGRELSMRSLKAHAGGRADTLQKAPWWKEKTPHKYLVVTDVLGFGEGFGHGIRSTDVSVARIELETVRQLGANGLRGAPPFMTHELQFQSGSPFLRGAIHGPVGYPVPRAKARHADAQAGCPFRDDVEERRRILFGRWVALARQQRVAEVWLLTVDEIATIFDLTQEGKRHVAVCPRCAGAFRSWLRGKGLSPSDFGARTWEGLHPVDVWTNPARPWEGRADVGHLAYFSLEFLNYATARAFTPLRDACRAHNEKKQREGGIEPFIYSYALRGNTFIRSGHSLDFFDFYRDADNAFVYETSHRDGRTWQWDAYMCDLGRVVSRREHFRQGIYVKPHRGAVVQRMLTAASRGATMIYWYTYGPDYAKGDGFSARGDVLAQTSWAARLLARAEGLLHDSRWVDAPQVGLFRSDVTQRWWKLAKDPSDQELTWEESKWLYTLLAHEHVAVDPLSDTALIEDSGRYRVIYVVGSHMTRAAAAKLREFVSDGGTAVILAGSATRDEANAPLNSLLPVAGLTRRLPIEAWLKPSVSGAGELPTLPDEVRAGAGARARVSDSSGSVPLALAREPLAVSRAESIATFDDGQVAVTRHRYGRGITYTFGYFPGLEYSVSIRGNSWALPRDLAPEMRRRVAQPALDRVPRSVVPSHPLVDGVLVESRSTAARGVVLTNWSFSAEPAGGRFGATVEAIRGLSVLLRNPGAVARARSLATGSLLALRRTPEGLVLTLPFLADGDVVALER